MSDNDLGLIAEPATSHDDLGLMPDKTAQDADQAVKDMGMTRNENGDIIKPDMVDKSEPPAKDSDLGLVGDENTAAHKEMADLFAEDNKQNPVLAAEKSGQSPSAMETGLTKAIDTSIGTVNKIFTGKSNLSEGEQAEIAKHPVTDFLGSMAGFGLTYSALAATGAGALVAGAGAGALSATGNLADHIKDSNKQLSVGQMYGDIGWDAAASAITMKIFGSPVEGSKLMETITNSGARKTFMDQVSSGWDQAQEAIGNIFTKNVQKPGQTIADRLLERGAGATATAITQSLGQDKIEGQEPNVQKALINGAAMGITVAATGAVFDIPELRGIAIDEAKSRLNPDGTFISEHGPVKYDADNLTINEAKKILADPLINVNPESLSPDFQAAAYEVKKKAALELADKKAESYGIDRDTMLKVMNDPLVTGRDQTLSKYLTGLVKTDPARAEKLLPFYNAIKNGADPVDVLLYAHVLDKFKQGSSVQSEQSVGKTTNPVTAAMSEKEAPGSSTTNEEAKVGAEQAKEPIVQPEGSKANTKASSAGPRTFIGLVNSFGGMDFNKAPEVAQEDKKGLWFSHREGAQSPDALAQEMTSKGHLPEGTTGDMLLRKMNEERGKILPHIAANETDYDQEYKQWQVKNKGEYAFNQIEGTDIERIEADLTKEGEGKTPQELLDWTDNAEEPARKVVPPQQDLEQDKKELGLQEDGPKYKIEAPAFYSQASKVIDEKMSPSATPEQIRGMLSEKNGVKQDELKWIGLDDFLQGKEKVTKAELQDFIAKNNVQIKEVVKGGKAFEGWSDKEIQDYYKDFYAGDPEGKTIDQIKADIDKIEKEDGAPSNSDNEPKFAQYQLPGGSNYRELLLTLPSKETKVGKPVPDGAGGLAQATVGTDFKSSHFDEPNILAHIRMNDRTDADGKKVLFIEEVQSDWHQKGKKQGYKTDSHIDKDFQEGVPDAPFKKTWHELAMKRMLRYAAENGYDKLAWTTGEQQAERYDLSKEINSIGWEKEKGTAILGDFKVIKIEPKNAGMIYLSVDKDGHVGRDPQHKNYDREAESFLGKNIEDVVGKEIAAKIMQEEDGLLAGQGLKVGGQGMKGFYDTILPSFMNKYVKKWGSKVENTSISHAEEYPGVYYEGPEYTLDQLKDALKISRGNGNIYESPLTGQKQHFVVTRVSISGPLGHIVREIEGGRSFKDAVNDNLSFDIAEMFGGKVKSNEADTIHHKVHSVEITPLMRARVMEGQPLFKTQPTWNDLKKSKSDMEKANKAGIALIKKYAPQLADSLVNPAYIYTKDGAHALGMYYKGQIHVKSGQGLNVYVHELGHAVFDLFLTPTEKADLLAEGRKIYGNDTDVEERIMEDFEQYAKDQRFIPDTSLWGKVKSFFKGLTKRLQQFIGVSPVSIQGFYNSILEGQYASATPNKEISANPSYKSEEQIEYKGPSMLDPSIAAVAKSANEIKALIAPRTLVPREALDMIMKMKGTRDKLEFVLETKLIKLEKAFDKMPKEEQVAFIDRIKTGTKQPTEALQQVADMMRIVEDNHWNQAKEFKPTLAYKENHYRVMWKVIPGSDEAKGGFHGLFKRPFQGSQGWAKKSTLTDMSEGIKAGGVPYSFNPITMWKNSIMDMQKFTTARRMWNNLKEMGYVKFVRPGESAPAGFVVVDDRISHVYLPVEATPKGSDSSFDATVEMGKYFVEPGSGRILNNFLGRDYIRESQIGSSLLAFKNFTTGIELSLSPFHAAYVTLMASSSNIGLGLQKISNRGLLQADAKGFLDGLKDIVHGVPVAGGAHLYKIGSDAIRYIGEEEFLKSKDGQSFIKAFPAAAELLDDLFTGGGKLAIHQDYKITSLKAFTQGIKDFGDAKNSFLVAQANGDTKLMQKYSLEMAGSAWAETVHLLPSVNQMIMRPLFEVYIPRLKIGAFLKEYSNDLVARKDQLDSGRITRAQLARDTWDSVERRFGEMNFDNLFWNRNFKTALQLAFRSVTWKLGALQNIGGAGTGQIKDLSIALKDKQLPKLNRNLASLLGLAFMVTVLAEVMQKLLTDKHLGQRDDGQFDLNLMFKDCLDPRYSASGDRLFFNTHLKDWAHLFHSPGGFVSNSLSGIWGRLFDDWRNKDFFNTQIRNPRDPAYRQGWDLLVHLMPLPFMITNQYQLKVKNAPDAVKALTAAGFTTPAPGYVNETPVMSLAKEIASNKPYAQVTRTKEQEAKFQAINTLKQNFLSSKDPGPLQDAEKRGLLTFQQYLDIKKEAGQNPLIHMTKHFTFDDVSQLMQKAIETKSVDEQNTLWPIVREKYFSTQERAKPDDRAQNAEVYKDIRAKLGK